MSLMLYATLRRRFSFFTILLLPLLLLSYSTLFAVPTKLTGMGAVPIAVSKGNNHSYTIRVLTMKNGKRLMVDMESMARALRLTFRQSAEGLIIEESLGKRATLCAISNGNHFVRVTSRNADVPERMIQLSSTPLTAQSRIYLPINQACRLLTLWLNRPVEYNEATGRITASLKAQDIVESVATIGLIKKSEEQGGGDGNGSQNKSAKTVITGIDVENRANGSIITFMASGPLAQAALLKPDTEGNIYFSFDNASCDVDALTKVYKSGMVRAITAKQFPDAGLQFTIALDTRSSVINSVDFQYNKKNNSYAIYTRSNADVEAIRIKEKEQQIAQVLSRDVEKWKLNTIVLDAGHGGKDPGAIGGNGTQEKDVVLNIVHDLGTFIEQKWPDVRVIYTRKDNTFIPLHERGKIANRHGGKLFISVHCNASPNHSARGSEVYILGAHKNQAALDVAMLENAVIRNEADYQNEYKGFTEEHLIMSSMAQNAFAKQSTTLAQDILQPSSRKVVNSNRAVRQAGFMVLWTPSMPSALVEVGYVSNPAEEQILRDRQEQAKIAYGIFKGIQIYRKNYETSTMASMNQ